MRDFVEASASITPAYYQQFTLLFEALAYEANDGVCYDKVF